ncbi:glycosyltransferase family 8 protein [Tabrizicola sp. BL-A-41-H6]|uniref:glycosyltransferase family 8 protein n=1 Tax=Tabrizicola sp. BL-A-41-H6 TaxID=3421107 RepID=UPI003D66A8E9
MREACVVVCSDAAWAWQSAFVLARSIGFDADRKLDHHAYLIGEVSNDAVSAFPAEAVIHRLESYPDNFAYDCTNHVPKAAMLRLFALEELATRYRRVIYLDGDIYQAWGSLADLLALPETGRPLAAVRDRSHWFDRPRLREQKTYVGRLNPAIGERYFNSGMMVVNGPVWDAGRYSRAALQFFSANAERCRYGDQSALNGVVEGNWDSLSPGWNWQISKTSFPLLAGRNPRLVHFTGPTKPWADRLRLFDGRVFEAMKAFLEAGKLLHLLDPATTPDSFTASQERRRMLALEPYAGDAVQKREKVKQFLDLPTHVDIAQGLTAYDMA